MSGLQRTHYCGDFSIKNVGEQVVVCGWTAKQRDLGVLIFVDLRDKTGIVQLAFDDNTKRDIFDKAFKVRSEFVLMAKGVVRERSSKNLEIPTGEIEIAVEELRVLGVSETTPFEITDNCQTSESVRLKHRYLDLRRPVLQNNIMFRHKVTKITRDYFDEHGFIEIETPILVKSTPEGARDFLVPSRIHPGEFYALPQSPQLYKQLSMVAGFDRYMQIARCFRDEDLRADRQPEFTQIDFEMSFVDVEDVLGITEGYIKRVFSKALGIDIETPIERMTYKSAIERFGSDKPDTRYEMELFSLNDEVRDIEFKVFSQTAIHGRVGGFTAKNAGAKYSRKEIDKLTEEARGIGAKGLAWIKLSDDGISSSFSKFVTDDEMNAIIKKAKAETGDIVFIVADSKINLALTVLGTLRTIVAKKLDIIKSGYNFLWIVDMPFFELDEESGEWVAMHHPFTSPTKESLDYLETDKSKVLAKAYDLVLNGVELSSGSIRVTDPVLQKRIFTLLGLSDEEAHRKFGYLLEAFKYGPPPHGGMGIGLDRLIMQMQGCESLRDVTAFPKTQNACELMTQSPSPADSEQLKELSLKIIEKTDK
ncbi:MAG TPA: aspartate--tRNA ligase [Oscillospiraceae bacterium]|nr:aspartate--tRNA ligase [Oscillospiraceae bacterium]